MISDHEIVEVCPYCDNENIYPEGSCFITQYIGVCQHCGKKTFLCDECIHSEDNPTMSCDWREEYCGGACMRGRIRNEI